MENEYWKSSVFGTDSIFHSSFDEKKLTIKYISCQKDDTYVYLNFDVTAKNLSSSNAAIYVKNNKNIVLAPLNDIKIGRNGTTSVETKFEISLLQKKQELKYLNFLQEYLVIRKRLQRNLGLVRCR
jgi:hypothetical protein